MPARILLVEDVDELRAVIAQTIRLRPDLEVVAESNDGRTAIALARQLQPDVVVLDLGLPDIAGQEVLSRLRAAAPTAQVVVYSGTHTADRRALARRAEGFVSKQHEVKYLVDLLGDLSRRDYRAAHLELSGGLSDVSVARTFLRDRCLEWGCGTVLDDALLVLSELAGNAVVHARSRVEVRLAMIEGMLRIEVTDHGGGEPDVQAPEPGADHGRGLLMVSMLSASWGVDALTGGKVVWAEVHVNITGGGGGSAGPVGPPPAPLARPGAAGAQSLERRPW